MNQSSSFESVTGLPLNIGQSSCGSFSGTSPTYEDNQQQQQLISQQQQQQKQQPQETLLELEQQQQQKIWSINAAGAREAFAAQSGSSGFLSAGSTTSGYILKQTFVNLTLALAGSSSISMLSGASTSNTSIDSSSTPHPHYQQLNLQLLAPSAPPPLPSAPIFSRYFGGTSTILTTAPSSTAPHHSPAPQLFSKPQQLQHQSLGLLSAFSPSSATMATTAFASHSASAPSTMLARPTALAPGHHFTPADKQLFTQAVMQFCAQDIHNWDVVEGEGFKNLVDTGRQLILFNKIIFYLYSPFYWSSFTW
jgi:hypothetical protein